MHVLTAPPIPSLAKRYRAYRVDGIPVVLVHQKIGDPGTPLVHVRKHSLGFEWAYAGSGPADLALSLLADYFDEHPTPDDLQHALLRCTRLYQHFKFRFVTPAPEAGFLLTGAEIAAWVATPDIQDELTALAADRALLAEIPDE